MSKITYLLLSLILISGIAYSEESKVKIIQENGYYCTQLESGEKFQIVRLWEPQSSNTVVLSPDQEYVAYTTSNHLGFESEGRDVFYCKIDGSERTFLHKFGFAVDTLLWDSYAERNFIFVIFLGCEIVDGGIRVVDLESKDIILTIFGDSLYKESDSDCYQVFCKYGAVPQGGERTCAQDLLARKETDSSNVSLLTGWSESDIYISTQREPVLKISDLPELAEKFEKKFGELVKNNYFYISTVVFSAQYNTIAFIGAGGRSFGLFDLGEKKLLLFDYSDSLGYANPTWSPDGSRLALLKRSSSGENIDFYELKGEGKVDLIKTYEVMTEMPVSSFRWSDDSETFYFTHLSLDNQRIEEPIDLSR